jgi:hypothetical protein
MIPAVLTAARVACPCIRQGHAFGRLTRCRVVDHCVVQSASCMP